jgi:hypothetical protein
MAKYTVRVTQEEAGHFAAWIDQDGKICIKQENTPGEIENFATETAAKAWADNHAAELEAAYEAGIAAQEAAAQQATKLDEIHSMLVNLTSGK